MVALFTGHYGVILHYYQTFIIFYDNTLLHIYHLYGNTHDTCFRTAEREDEHMFMSFEMHFKTETLRSLFISFHPPSFLKVKVPFLSLVTTLKQNKTVQCLKGTPGEVHICKTARCVIKARRALLKSAQEAQGKLTDLHCRWTLLHTMTIIMIET